MKHDLEKNKKNAIAFYKTAYDGNPRKAVEQYVGAEYIQHNPLVGNGKEPFIEYFERMKKEYPKKVLNLSGQLQKTIWLPYILIKPGQVVMNTSQWIFLDLMRRARL
ncbi:MAG: hypothetical protein P8X73_18575 [Ignavibacteriaceae bacterium]